MQIDRRLAAPSPRARIATRIVRWLCRSVAQHFGNDASMLGLRRKLALIDRARGLLALGQSEWFRWERGIVGGVRVRAVHPHREAADAEAPSVLLYLHGGAFLLRALNAHMNLAAGIARSAGLQRVVMPIYRLAPECPYPAAIANA